MKNYLLLPKVRIHNANAASSPYTVGFPPMTAWLGFMHALERRLWQARDGKSTGARLSRVAVSCHEMSAQLYKGAHDYRYSIVGTANPLKKKGAGFERPPFIEEPRVHLKVSLLIELENIAGHECDDFKDLVAGLLPRMKIAGGDVQKFLAPEIISVNEDEEKTVRKALSRLIPGYVIIERRDLLKNVAAPQDALDALLDALAVHYEAKEREADEAAEWEAKKRHQGWLVPIAVGFKDISGPMQVKNMRSNDYEHHFVEPVVTLGEFKMPYRFNDVNEIMWEYCHDAEHGLYLCKNQFT